MALLFAVLVTVFLQLMRVPPLLVGSGLGPLLCLLSVFSALAFEDEFVVRGPGALHRAAIDALTEERRKTGTLDVFKDDSEMMQKAKAYAVNRFISKPDEALKISVTSCCIVVSYIKPCACFRSHNCENVMILIYIYDYSVRS